MAQSSGAVQVSLSPSDLLSRSSPTFTTDSTSDNGPEPFLQRAASFNSIPEDIEVSPGSPGIKRTFSDVSLSGKTDSPSKENFLAGKDILRRVSLRSPNSKSRIAVSRFTLSNEESNEASKPPVPDATMLKEKSHNIMAGDNSLDADDGLPEIVARPTKARSVSGKIATLVCKTWMSPSRSPSPASKGSRRRLTRSREESPTRRVHAQSAESSPLNGDPKEAKAAAAAAFTSMEPSRKKTALNKKSRRPLSAFVSRNRSEDLRTSLSSVSLQSKTSLEKLTSSANVSAPVLPPLPVQAPLPTLADQLRKKDRLWSVFRNLEAEYQKFQGKPSTLKVHVIRSALVPFLMRYAAHPSIHDLRPEDLDRRVNILNKWWTGLLEILNGKNHQSISGTDRPIYLEAVAGIMMRPEWQIPYPFSQVSSSVQMQPSSVTSSKSSLDSGGSDFLVESIHHNIRNIFVQNLLSQMSFVVGRMSMRHAPASLVAFCGKACAYAFFFCPGVADMLVRLWNTSSDVLRRVLADSAVHWGLEARSVVQELAQRFPPAVKTLAFSSHAALVRYLRLMPNVPLNVSQILWHGPWLSRWCGRDTDLFFVFVKYFHMLLSEFIAPDMDRSKRIFAPGVLSVHGQLLVVLEDTLYRQSAPQMPENPFAVTSITFDDLMEGPDASVSSLPLGSANCHRSMAENRLIILLRDFLSESSHELSDARRLYAETFTGILKSATRKTSLFDHNACFVLCDFIEEAVTIISRYCQLIKTDIFDWSFWLNVCKQMTRSHNSLTEVRVFAFIFCIWSNWTTNEERKRDLCLDFLLHEDYFYYYFSHWSPMVRAYFHRLLCWRVARFASDPSPIDSTIYETLLDRLEQIWVYYLSFQSAAAKELRAPLSSAPCSPAPGRRIIIIRSDNHPSPTNMFMSFDRMLSPTSSLHTSGYRGHGLLKLDLNGLPPENQTTQKKKWNILKTMFGATTNPKPGEVTPPGSSSDESETNPLDTIMGPAIGPNPSRNSHEASNQGTNESESLRRPVTPHQPYCFKFSLEMIGGAYPSKSKRLFTPCLPDATQYHVQRRRSRALARQDGDDPSDSDEEPGEGGDHTDGSTTGTYDSYVTTKTSVEADEVVHKQLRNERLVASKYAGRALAEWAMVVSECDSFFERRREEGVPSDRLVETPTLSVDNFRK